MLVGPISSPRAQVNTSQENNYRNRDATGAFFSTRYDNGFVTLRDGNVLRGKISLHGKSYDELNWIDIRSNSGKKYAFYLRSLSEFGLDNSTVNETPDLFWWSATTRPHRPQSPEEVEAGRIRILQKARRSGYTSFGYVNMKDGKRYEGEINLNEVNGRIESIQVREGKGKRLKLEPQEVKSYGVQRYEDPKFVNPWSLVTWKQSIFSGPLVNTKSNDMPGYVMLNGGEKQIGSITLVKKNDMIIQVHVKSGAKGKTSKIKHKDIQSYGVDLTIDSYNEILKNWEIPYEEIRPEYKFFPGTITTVDEEVKEGLIARVALNTDFTDLYFAPEENSPVEVVSATEVEEFEQNIPDQAMQDYNSLIYNRDHIKGYLIQRPPQWIYKTKKEDAFRTEFQPGYIVLTSGEEKVGAISVIKQGGTISKYEFREAGKEDEKYFPKVVDKHGLIVQEARTAFPHRLFRERRSGFIQLLGSDKKIEGELEIKDLLRIIKEGETYMRRTFILRSDGSKEEYPEGSVDIYGLRDVPTRELTGDGVIIYEDQKQNFHPGSFSYNGSALNGYIAWAPPNDAGEYDAFFFTPEQGGEANVYYASRGSTGINQMIEEEIEEYDPLNDSFLQTMTIDKEAKNNGYVVTSEGEKIEGAIQLSFPPKLWFATDATLTESDGTVSNYSNDGSLKKIVVTLEGQQQEFVRFKNEYAEVLHRDGNLVHFRNPHPTTPSFAGDMINYFLGEMANAAQEEIDKKLAEEAAKKIVKGDWDEGQIEAFNTYMNRDKTDFINVDFIAMYAPEHIVLDDESERYVMYVPKGTVFQMHQELMGCMEYVIMEKDEQRGLRRMRNPMRTMQFLNKCFNE